MSMTIDFKEFEAGFKRIVENTVPEEGGKGLVKAGNELLKDAKERAPQAPFKEGHLWASARTEEAQIGEGEISVQAGFNIEYAARWHEIEPTQAARINWTTHEKVKNPGPKYLESKMAMFLKKYIEIVAAHIRGAAK